MKPHSAPFARDTYDLTLCSLGPLHGDTATWASHRLAAMDPWRTLGYSPEGLQRYLLRDDPALKRYVMSVSGDPAGVVCVRHPWLLGAYLELIAVFEDFQGRGMGRCLIQWMFDETRDGSNNLWALVSSFNDAAQSFYRRLGFTEATPLPELLGPGTTELLLRKRR